MAVWLPRTVSQAPCLEKDKSSEQDAGDAPGHHSHQQGQLRTPPCLSRQNSSQRWLWIENWMSQAPWAAITSWCHLPWGSHISRTPQESTELLSCALSPFWCQEPSLGEVYAALGKLWWKVRAQRCSWKTWMCHPRAASGCSVFALSPGLQWAQGMQSIW